MTKGMSARAALGAVVGGHKGWKSTDAEMNASPSPITESS